MLELSDERVQRLARVILGPHEFPPEHCRFTLDELRETRWNQSTGAEQNAALRGARAVLGEQDADVALQPEGSVGGVSVSVEDSLLSGSADLVEELAKHLHDEHDEHTGGGGENWTWPEHEDDDGYRAGGYVNIAPTDVRLRRREASARILRFLEGYPRTKAILARLTAPGGGGTEPVAWSFELANSIEGYTNTYHDWSAPQLSFTAPNVPEGAVRNLRPLYASAPVLTPDRKLTIAREALGFYANTANWIDTPPWDGDPEVITPKAIPVERRGEEGQPCDCGDRARRALREIEALTPSDGQVGVPVEGTGLGLGDAMLIAKAGFEKWAAKPHNSQWVRKIDGTPIPNDLPINIAQAFVDEGLTLSARPTATEG